MRLNRHTIDPKTWDKLWNRLTSLIGSSKKRESELLLHSLLPPAEQIMMVKRLMVGIMTVHGWDPSTIASHLKLSKSSVYKYQRILEKDTSYRKMLVREFPPSRARRSGTRAQLSPTLESFATLLDAILTGRNQRHKLHQVL